MEQVKFSNYRAYLIAKGIATEDYALVSYAKTCSVIALKRRYLSELSSFRNA